MTKFTQGDVVVITDSRCEGGLGRIENWRGGNVAPYVVRILETTSCLYKNGDLAYFSGREMELKDMQGKKKVYCCMPRCVTYSFESKGTMQWLCHKHCELKNCELPNYVSLEDKIDLILEHLGLEVTIEPQKVVLTKVKDDEQVPSDQER